jgi:urease subunit gamma/beta
MASSKEKWAAPKAKPSTIPTEAIDVGDPKNAGKITFAADDIEINAGRPTKELVMVNTGDRPVQIGSHYHLAECNRAMAFDREAAFGMRLDWLSGAAFRFEPGQERKVPLTTFVGREVALGMNNMTNGSLRSEQVKERTMRNLRARGYCFEGERYPVKQRADEAFKDAPMFHYERKK